MHTTTAPAGTTPRAAIRAARRAGITGPIAVRMPDGSEIRYAADIAEIPADADGATD